MIGITVGNYKILEELGEGGVGKVYKGVDTMLDREVAIKILRPELASQGNVVERFRSEAITLAKLHHPNIATLFSLFRNGSDLVMVLEFIRGEALDRLLYRRGKISAEEAIPFFCQALEGINYAHEHGIIHRDIKPGNVILTDSGVLKVLDFGIARLLGTNRMTRVGNVIGTLEYMSPEQIRGEETDARSDIYSLGVMLYEILTGRLPFESENDFALMTMQTEQQPVSPRRYAPEIPQTIENAILKAMEKRPTDRFQNIREFSEDLVETGLAFPQHTLGFGTVSKHSKPEIPKPLNSKDEAMLFPSDLSIPKPTISLEAKQVNIPVNKPVIKETVIARSPKSAPEMIVPTVPIEQPAPNYAPSFAVEENTPNSFFAKIGVAHYAIAGSIFLLFGLISTIIFVPMLFSKTPAKQSNVTVTKSAENKSESTSETTKTTTLGGSDVPVTKEGSDIPLLDKPVDIGQQNPTETGSSEGAKDSGQKKTDNPPAQNQPKPREREEGKNNPPPAQPQQPKRTSPPPQSPPKNNGGGASNTAPRNPPSGGSKGGASNLRNILTDN